MRTPFIFFAYNRSTMQSLKKLPLFASIVAFFIAAIIVLEGLLGPIVIVPCAIVPLCAGVGILRRHVWAAYGFATCLFAQVLLLPMILFRPGQSLEYRVEGIVSASFSVLLGVLFVSAGRSLIASDAAKGRAAPWIVCAALSIVPFFFVQTFEIPGKSMENTLLPGDRILATTYPVQHPGRGELVLFISPQDRSLILVKRVIAIPGDHLRISRNVVILNGTALDEKHVDDQAHAPEFYPEEFPNDIILPGCTEGHEMLSQHVVNGEIRVPEGKYFVLGDNRENSLDSRCWGFISSSDLISKPLLIYDSIDHLAEETPHPGQNWRGQRRWSRIFKLVA